MKERLGRFYLHTKTLGGSQTINNGLDHFSLKTSS